MNDPQRNSKKASPSFYVIEVEPSYYDVVREGLDYYPIPAIDHLPEEPKTFKDFEHNVAREFKDVAVGDSLVFHCTQQKPEYSADIERKIERIDINQETHTKLLYLKKEPVPAWKKRRR